MNRYQTNIIWLGLILIALNIIVNIGEFKSVLFGSGPGGNTGGTNSVPVPSKSAPSTSSPALAPSQLPVQAQPTPSSQMV